MCAMCALTGSLQLEPAGAWPDEGWNWLSYEKLKSTNLRPQKVSILKSGIVEAPDRSRAIFFTIVYIVRATK